MQRPLTLLLIGAGFAAGMTLAMSCNLGRSSTTHNAVEQGHGDKEKHEAKDGDGDEDDDDEVPIKFAEAPELVRTAILKLTPEQSITKLTREEDDHHVVFEVNYDSNGAKSSAALTDQGIVMELEKDVRVSDLPRAAADAIAKRYPSSTIKSVTSVQEFKYEAKVEADGKAHHVAVNAAGKMQKK
jgi:hypothetical protein